MQILYSSSGAKDFEVLAERYTSVEWHDLSHVLQQLLEHRKKGNSIRLLTKLPWMVCEATNLFGDEFAVLYARLSLKQYVEVDNLEKNIAARDAAEQLAHTLTEIVPDRPYIRHVAFVLDPEISVNSIADPEPTITSSLVRRTLDDAERFVRMGRAVSGVDRVHTALVGYLRIACQQIDIFFDENDRQSALLKKLIAEHPNFQLHSHVDHIVKILRSMGAILDALDPIRNRASVAHANENLLEESEALLVINIARTIIHYVDARLNP